MFWKIVNLVSAVATLFVALGGVVFWCVRWRRLKSERRQFLEKSYRLQGLYGSHDQK